MTVINVTWIDCMTEMSPLLLSSSGGGSGGGGGSDSISDFFPVPPP